MPGKYDRKVGVKPKPMKWTKKDLAGMNEVYKKKFKCEVRYGRMYKSVKPELMAKNLDKGEV